MQSYINIKDNTYLKISVAHRDAGLTARGNEVPRGVIVSFTVIERDGMWEKCSPYDNGNYNVQAVVYKRRNQKAISKVEQFVKDNVEKLFELWKDNQRANMVEFITNGVN